MEGLKKVIWGSVTVALGMFLFAAVFQTAFGSWADINTHDRGFGKLGDLISELKSAKTGEEPVAGGNVNATTGGGSQQAASDTSGTTVGQTTITGGSNDGNGGNTVIQSQSTINTTTTISSTGGIWGPAGPAPTTFTGSPMYHPNGSGTIIGWVVPAGPVSIPSGVCVDYDPRDEANGVEFIDGDADTIFTSTVSKRVRMKTDGQYVGPYPATVYWTTC